MLLRKPSNGKTVETPHDQENHQGKRSHAAPQQPERGGSRPFIPQFSGCLLYTSRLFDELGIEPEIYHLNEAHGLAAAFHVLAKTGSVEEVRKR